MTHLNIKAKTSDTVLGPKEESKKEGETQREKVSPTGQGGLKTCQHSHMNDRDVEMPTLMEYRQTTPITKLMISTVPHHQRGTSLYLLRRTSL